MKTVKSVLVFILVFLKWTVVNLVMAIPHAVKGAYRAAWHPNYTPNRPYNGKPRFIGPHDGYKKHSNYNRGQGHDGYRGYHQHRSRW